jgi:pimeloyl-ACP methyl ester carboxylesterase
MAEFKGRGFKIHYVEEGEGEPIVFLHGLGLDHTMFVAQFEDLPDSYRCIALDLRGHGHTASPDGRWTISDLAADVIAFIEDVDAAPCHLVGMSWGGMVAMQVAIDRPDLVRSLVLIDTSASAMAEGSVAAFRQLIETVEERGVTRETSDLLIPLTFGERYRAENEEGVAAQRSRLHDIDKHGFAEAMRSLSERPPLTDRLGSIAVPTLVIHGEQDAAMPISEGEALASTISGAELVRVPGAGHATPIEAPDDVNAALVRFFARVD